MQHSRPNLLAGSYNRGARTGTFTAMVPSPVEKLPAEKFQNLSHVYVVFLGHGVKVQDHTRIEENVNFRLLKVNVNIGQTSSIKITEKQTVVAGVT